MKQKIKLKHKSGPVEITIEGSNEIVVDYIRNRIEEIFGPVEEGEKISEKDIGNFKDLFGDAFGDLFKGFKK